MCWAWTDHSNIIITNTQASNMMITSGQSSSSPLVLFCAFRIWCVLFFFLLLETTTVPCCRAYSTFPLICTRHKNGLFLGSPLHPRRHRNHHLQPGNNRNRKTTTTSSATSLITIFMGLQIKIRIVGKEKSGTHDQWIQQACHMYTSRLQSSQIEVVTEWHKSDDALLKGISGDISKGNSVVLLDPHGNMPTSEIFSQKMYHWLEQGGSRLVFVIGGAEGLPWELKSGIAQGADKKPLPLPLLSLSKLTFTHQFARLLLVEQIYRASEIQRGSNYHK